MPALAKSALAVEKFHGGYIVKGSEFAVSFNREGMSAFNYRGVALMHSGMKVNLWRAPTDNDIGGAKLAAKWEKMGLDRILCRNEVLDLCEKDDCAVITVQGVYGQKMVPPLMRVTQVYTVTGEGKVALDITYAPLKDIPEYFPRLGLRMEMPEGFERIVWQGRGPQESYPDKKTGALLGRYETTVDETHEPYVRPQENGAHDDTTFAALLNARGIGLMTAGNNFSFSAHHYTPEMLTAAQHTIELGRTDEITLCLDGAMGPLGTNSCGPEPQEDERLYLKEARSFHFAFLPLDAQSISLDAAYQVMK